ncbi:MAG: PKD domain-containing protein [Saprospiraceae bacterium]|nr:PKD domain-containing protein [Saprospiraceae bacterium]
MRHLLFLWAIIITPILLKSQCDADFDLPNGPYCGGETIVLAINNPTNGYNYQWQADGQNLSIGNTIFYTVPFFSTNQNVTITVFGLNQDSGVQECADAASITALAAVDPILMDIGFDPVAGEVPFTNCGATPSEPDYLLEVSNNSTPSNLIQTWTLEWGDGDTESGNGEPPATLDHLYQQTGTFNLVFTIIATNGCESTFEQEVFNGSNPAVGLENPGGTVNICAPEQISFPITGTTDNAPGTEYTIFVNGEQVAFFNHPPPATFDYTFNESSCGQTTTDGTFNNSIDVRIEASNPCFTSASIVQPITVGTPPTTSFSGNLGTSGCLDDTFIFTNTTVGATFVSNQMCNEAVSLDWTITPNTFQLISGELSGNNLNAANELEIIFDAVGTYTVTLTAGNNCGEDTFSQQITISPETVADAIPDNFDPCVPTSITYNDQSLNAVFHCWDIAPSTGWSVDDPKVPNPTFTFFQAGEYIISLTVDGCGEDVWMDTVVVADLPDVDLAAIADVCGETTFTFAPTISENGCAIESCEWTFTNSAGQEIFPNTNDCGPFDLLFDVPDTYFVNLDVTNCCGTTTVQDTFIVFASPMASANFNLDTDCVPSILSIDNQSNNFSSFGPWTVTPSAGFAFIGGTDANSFDPIFQFFEAGTYTISLEIFNEDCSEMDTWETTISVNAPPSVDLTEVPPATDCGSISFTPNANIEDGGCAASCEWTISTITGTVIQTFNVCDPPQVDINDPGGYVLTLATTNCCETVTIADTFFVSEFPIAEADADLVGEFGCAPSVICFTNNSSFNESNQWTITPNTGINFVNGTNENSDNPCIEFTERGTYDVQLMISNSCDMSVWDTTIIIFESPSAIIDPIDDGCDELTFTPNGMIDDGGCAVSCEWTLQLEGMEVQTFSTCTPPELTLNDAGNYTMELTLTNCCDVVTITEDFFIQASESVDAGPDTSLCAGDPCLPLSTDGTWTDPDGNVITEFCPETAGTFELTFTLTTGLCSGSDVIELIVHPLPVVTITNNPLINELCTNDAPIQYTAEPLGGTWSSSGIGLSANGALDPFVAGVGIDTITYTYTEPSTGCTNFAEFEVTIEGPQLQSIPDTTLCESDQNIDLEALYGIIETGGSGTWDGPGIIDADNGIFNSILAGSMGSDTTFQLTYTFETDFGCESGDSIDIQIIQGVQADAGPDLMVCISDSTLQLSANLSGIWSGEGVVNSGGLVDLMATGAGVFDFYYIVFEGESCETTDTVSVNIIDMNSVEAGEDLYLCETEGITTLTGFSLPADASGQWSGISFLDDVNGTFDVQMLDPGQYTLFYTATSNILNTCLGVDSMQLIVDTLPIPSFEIEGIPCIGEEVTFVNTTTGANQYEWTVNNVFAGDDPDLVLDFPIAGAYIIELTVFTINPTNSFDILCETTITEVLNISEPPLFVGFDATPIEGCADLEVLLSNQSIGENLAFIWWLDNDTLDIPSDSIITLGQGFADTLYTIRLEVNNNCGGEVASQEFLVYPRPIPIFATVQDTFCSGESIIIGNASLGNPDSYTWCVDGVVVGTGPIAPEIIIQSDSTSTHFISLKVENECDMDTLMQEVIIQPTDVNAFFSISDDEVCVGDTIFITNFSTFNVDVSYDFGNEEDFSNDANTFVVYDSAGTYTITQQAFGCGFDEFSVMVIVNPAPVPAFMIDPLYCEGTSIEPENMTVATGFAWYLNDSLISSEGMPLIEDLLPGNYTLALIAESNVGCTAIREEAFMVLPAPSPAFSFSDTVCSQQSMEFFNETNGNIQDCLWDFGDGNTSIDCNPMHTYEAAGDYIVCLQITDINGCRNTTCQIINVRATPVANFDYEVMDDCAPSEVTFINLSDSANAFAWDFGDDSLSLSANPTHVYAGAGAYVIELLAFNDSVCVSSFTQTITITPTPVADFTVDNFSICAPDDIQFTNTSSGNITSFAWDFGDSLVSFEENPMHFYDTPGTYTVTLIVNTGECKDTIQQEVEAFEPVLATATPTSIECFGETNGTISIEVFNGTAPFEYNWSDGGQEEDRVDLAAGIYTLTITDFNGCTWVESIEIIQPDSNIAIDVIDSIPATCFGDADALVTVAASGGTAAYSYEWSNGVQDSTILNVAAGIFTLTVTDANNCEAVFEVEALENQDLSILDTAINISCYDEMDGQVRIDSAFGGVQPYALSLDGPGGYNVDFFLNGNTGQLFSQLDPGTYQLSLMDAEGCTLESEYTIIEPSEIFVDILQEDTLLIRGTRFQLDLAYNVSQPIFTWTPADSLSCNGCDNPIARPFVSTTYTVTMVDENGCVATDDIFLEIEKVYQVYVPNVFSPNGDGNNDQVTVFGDVTVKEVKSFKIFDRWGAMVFENNDFLPNLLIEGWDGRHLGQRNTNVFVYTAEVEFIDGEVRFFKGDILLMR